jgi:hypothetical protein
MDQENDDQPSPGEVAKVTFSDEQPRHKHAISPSQEVQQQNEMDLDTATTVLQTIVDTHESSITSETQLDKIGGYTTEEIREAERVVAQSIMDKYGSEKRPYLVSTNKLTPQGKLHLVLGKDVVHLSLFPRDNNEPPPLHNSFALVEHPQHSEQRKATRFSDSLSGDKIVTSLNTLDKQPTLEGFQHMIRGVRWMNANMLAWNDPTTIMPEQLDNKPTSSIITASS